MADVYYPPGAFYFSVSMVGASQAGIDASFQEVSGIEATLDVENVEEGGENRFSHRLPRIVKYPNLVLKRGLVTSGSLLADWLTSTLAAGLAQPVVPKDLLVTLLNMRKSPLLSWTFTRAFPLRWELAQLNSERNEVLIETLELSYDYFQRVAG